MPKLPLPRLTSGELDILSALWRAGPGTISDVHAALGQPIGYTTVQTRLNRLVAKGVVVKSDERPAHYRAAFGPEEVSRHDLEILVRRVNSGQVVPLVAYLVLDRTLTRDEISDLRRLIDEAELHARRKSRPTRGKEAHK
jgi:predicted transcriptional regulator